MTEVKVVKSSRNLIEFDVRQLPPKNAVALNAAMEFDVQTLRVHTVNVGPQTNTAMDPKQWAQRIGQVPLDSRKANEFRRVNECDCESGGPCCNAEIQLQLTNTDINHSLNVYTDDLVATDPRVKPVHRTFKVLTYQCQPDGSLSVQTTEEHTISEGELVNVLNTDSSNPFWRAKTVPLQDRMILVPLFETKEKPQNIKRLEYVSNRQLLYVCSLQTRTVEN